jgi:hypothetical protein
MWQIARMRLPQGQFENLLAEPIAGCGMEGTLAQVAIALGVRRIAGSPRRT